MSARKSAIGARRDDGISELAGKRSPNPGRFRRGGIRTRVIGSTIIGVLLLLGLLGGQVRATTVAPPFNSPWENNGGWPPCTNGGSNTWNEPMPNAATGQITLYSHTNVNNQGFCDDDSALKDFHLGLHSANWFEATKSSAYTFSYQYYVAEYQYLNCNGFSDYAPGVYATTQTFFAIWDETTGTDTGNIYNAHTGLSSSDGSNCGYNPPWQGTNNVCLEEITVSTQISLQANHWYDPRVGVFAQTFADQWNWYTGANSIEDLMNYNQPCGVTNGVILASMSFQLSGNGPGQGPGVSIIVDPGLNSTLSG